MARNAVILNELSLDASAAVAVPAEALDTFSSLLAQIRRVSQDSYLVSSVQLWGAGVSAFAAFGPWARDPLNKDKLRQIMAMQNRAPFEHEFGILEGSGLDEYSHQGMTCIGLGYAHRLDLLAVSVSRRAVPAESWLEIERMSLSSDAETLLTEHVQVRHAAAPIHLAVHRDWLLFGQESPATGVDLWTSRRELFDRIDFLDRVEADLAALEGTALKAVHEKLTSMQLAVAQWQLAISPAPNWRTRVTPESSSRIDSGRCAFRDSSGVLDNYSLHARYTPGAGRIHFRLEAGRGRIVVAYIGGKL